MSSSSSSISSLLRIALLLAIPVVAPFVSEAAALAKDAAEVEMVRRATADVEAAVATTAAATPNDARASALLDRYVDVAAFEARVLADVSPSLTPQQRKTLSEALRPLLVRRIALRLNANGANGANAKPSRIESGPREENGETHIRIFYKSNSNEEEIDVDLSFGTRPPNATTPPRVVDATVAGTNLSKNLRASVNKVMRKDGFDGLVARLKQLRDETSTGPHKSSALTL